MANQDISGFYLDRVRQMAGLDELAGTVGGYNLNSTPPKVASPAAVMLEAATPRSAPPQVGYNANVAPGDIYKIIQQYAGSPENAAILTKFAQIESGMNPNAHNASGADGLFQFVPSTARQYGLTDTTDPIMSTRAAAALLGDNKRSLERALGREVTPEELYLAHQQGAGGAAAILKHPEMSAVDALSTIMSPEQAARNITSNGGDVGMSSRDFAGLWGSKYNGIDVSKYGGGQDTAGAPPDEEKFNEMFKVDPEQEKKNRRGNMWMALAEGLSQVSHGKPIDLSDIMDRMDKRYDRARQYAMQKYSEEERKYERAQDRDTFANNRAVDLGMHDQERAEDRTAALADAAAARQQQKELFDLQARQEEHMSALGFGNQKELASLGQSYTEKNAAANYGYDLGIAGVNNAAKVELENVSAEHKAAVAAANRDAAAARTDSTNTAAAERARLSRDAADTLAVKMEGLRNTHSVEAADVADQRARDLEAVKSDFRVSEDQTHIDRESSAKVRLADDQRAREVSNATKIAQQSKDPTTLKAAELVTTSGGAFPFADAYKAAAGGDTEHLFDTYYSDYPAEKQAAFREFAQARVPSVEDKASIIRLSNGSTNVTNEYKLLSDQRMSSDALKNMNSIMEQTNWTLPQGPVPAALLPLNTALAAAGYLSPDQTRIVGQQGAVQALKLSAMVQHVPPGAASDADMALAYKATPGIEGTPLGTHMLMQAAMANQNMAELHAAALDTYVNDPSHGYGTAGFEKEWSKMVDTGLVPDPLPDFNKYKQNPDKFLNLVERGYLKPGDLMVMTNPRTNKNEPVALTPELIDMITKRMTEPQDGK